ncbi:FMN-binding protein [Clostridium sp. 'deep sea']|uniref:FMN-binding protein n=1 Tax=Clostridium sp. 'deep sea' TaxID=2779445 RepID=UPI0018969919|nr:FMN-binding protein [Clostridium sp. 'deep sea']QOR36060.1 FMN-binding protein [Clostridium sp. 'deep sea']
MPKSLKLIVVLTTICVISAASLSYVYNNIAGPIIDERAKEAALKILNENLAGADDYKFIKDESTGKTKYYAAVKNGKAFGYAIPTSGAGFADAIKLMVVTDGAGVISKVIVLGHVETPGYGDKIDTQPEFLQQFVNMSLAKDEFVINKTIDKIAGATYTSKGAVKGVEKASIFYKDNIANGGNK